MSIGKLIICGNHSGNFLDVPQRTLALLKETKNIFCEDIDYLSRDIVKKHRVSMIDKNLFSVSEMLAKDPFGYEDTVSEMIKKIAADGEDAIFICDTGMPGFADIGTQLVSDMYDAGISVEIVPGPSVVSSSIAISGIKTTGRNVYSVALYDLEESEKLTQLSIIKSFRGLSVVLDFPDKVYENMELLVRLGLQDRASSLCIDIGMSTQRIIRKSIGELYAEKPNLENCYVSLVIMGNE